MIGIDLIYLPRFERVAFSRNGKGFERKVFSEAELRAAAARKGRLRALMLAERFAIKEAVIKASDGSLGLGDMTRIDTGGASGSPRRADIVNLDGSGSRYFVSVSGDGEYVVAVAARESSASKEASHNEAGKH